MKTLVGSYTNFNCQIGGPNCSAHESIGIKKTRSDGKLPQNVHYRIGEFVFLISGLQSIRTLIMPWLWGVNTRTPFSLSYFA